MLLKWMKFGYKNQSIAVVNIAFTLKLSWLKPAFPNNNCLYSGNKQTFSTIQYGGEFFGDYLIGSVSKCQLNKYKRNLNVNVNRASKFNRRK